MITWSLPLGGSRHKDTSASRKQRVLSTLQIITPTEAFVNTDFRGWTLLFRFFLGGTSLYTWMLIFRFGYESWKLNTYSRWCYSNSNKIMVLHQLLEVLTRFLDFISLGASHELTLLIRSRTPPHPQNCDIPTRIWHKRSCPALATHPLTFLLLQ